MVTLGVFLVIAGTVVLEARPVYAYLRAKTYGTPLDTSEMSPAGSPSGPPTVHVSRWRRFTAGFARVLDWLLIATVMVLIIPVSMQIFSRAKPWRLDRQGSPPSRPARPDAVQHELHGFAGEFPTLASPRAHDLPRPRPAARLTIHRVLFRPTRAAP
mgnify:CR=1 FL=1